MGENQRVQASTTPSLTVSTFQNAIGVFDSGVGGLSVLRAIRAALPHEHLVYVADSGHAPYGDQTEAHITQRTLTVGHWLAEQGVKGITIACNTATVVAAKTLREQTHLPVVAIEPAIKPAVALTRSGVVGVLATRQTVQSAAVARLVDLYAADKRVVLQACPGLVEQVERADLHSAETEDLLRQFITPLIAHGAVKDELLVEPEAHMAVGQAFCLLCSPVCAACWPSSRRRWLAATARRRTTRRSRRTAPRSLS